MAIFWISPTGSGTHNGWSAANAGTIYNLPGFIKAAGPGGEVRLIADKGAYKMTSEIAITAGGAAGAPVTIHGTDSSGHALAAQLVGTRPTGWKPGLAEGNDLFRLVGGANHLKFTDLAVKNIGNGAFRIGADISDIVIQRVSATNVSRFIEDYASGPATSASVSGLTVQDVTVNGYSKNAIRLQYNSHNVVLQNIVGDSQKQDGGLILAGVSMAGTAHDILLNHVTMKNNYGHGASTDYWNGDGFAAEGNTYNLTFQDTVASGNTDAGYDLKSNNTKLIRATATDNGKNFRLWGDTVTVTDSVSTNPKYFGGAAKTAHFWAANGADVTLDNFRYSDTTGTTEVFDLSSGANALKLVDMAMPAVARIHFGNNSVIKLPTGLVVSGTAGNDSLAGGTGNDMLIGGKGNDTYIVNATGDKPVEQGTEGTDLVKATLGSYTLADHVENLSYAGSGNFSGVGNNLNNVITGGLGNDRLDGMMGNDTLTGGQGADTYVYGSGGKQDTIYNSDSGAPDKLVFKSGITETELWFGKTGNDLLVTLRGTGNTDSVRLKNWYSDPASHLSQFQLSDGSVLEASHVQQIVQAMASFTTSAGGPTNLTGAQEQTVDTVIAANWHATT